MGTRNLTKVIDRNGVVRVAQYGQWDGYPSYSGVRILEFITPPNMLSLIEKSLYKCRFVEQGELDAAYAIFNESELRNEFEGFGVLFPSLSRNTGVDILKTIVYSNKDVMLWNDEDFQNDGLFCEGIYTLDFQKNEFTSWFNGDKIVHSFSKLPTESEYLAQWQVLTPAQ